ncbi:hypothetical protein T484DRAFT_1864164 [Baffinella frigidus]|nr:hypothetical protein T484DRAFT_1864164 [Cryptophyta sp. CCMP2293]
MDHVGVLLTGKPIPVEETGPKIKPEMQLDLVTLTLLPFMTVVACMQNDQTDSEIEPEVQNDQTDSEIEPEVQNDQTDFEIESEVQNTRHPERCEFPMSLILLNLVTLLPAMIVACMASIFMDKIGHNRLLFVMVLAFLVYFFTQATAYKKLQESYTISTACVTQLIETTEELSKTNEELSKTNEELSKTNEELFKTNEELSKTNEELSKMTAACNEELSKMTAARKFVLELYGASLAEHAYKVRHGARDLMATLVEEHTTIVLELQRLEKSFAEQTEKHVELEKKLTEQTEKYVELENISMEQRIEDLRSQYKKAYDNNTAMDKAPTHKEKLLISIFIVVGMVLGFFHEPATNDVAYIVTTALYMGCMFILTLLVVV